MQVLIMYVAKGVFKVEKQTGLEWLFAILVGISALPVALLVKLISRCGAAPPLTQLTK